MQTDGLADAPPDAVTYDGFAEPARRGKTDAWSAGLAVPDAESREVGSGKACAPIINATKIRGSQQTNTFRKARDVYLSELTVSL
jgi:hypothetical protein